MSRRLAAAVVCATTGIAVIPACQNYNFSPVRSCIIQPGHEQVKLGNVTSADVLFLVDDSGSMDTKQQALAQNFNVFIDALAQAQKDRISKQLEPFDFHIAVTTSSIYSAFSTSSCVSKGGGAACSTASCACTEGRTCADAPTCTPGADCPGGGKCVRNQIVDARNNVIDVRLQCCPVSSCTDSTSCIPGEYVPQFQTTYPTMPVSVCTQGVAPSNGPFPSGQFVSAGANPKVLHFTKDLNWANWPGDPAINTLVQDFIGTNPGTGWSGGNIEVGSCGSGQEQHLQSARLALQKALSGQQPDVTASDWPHLGARLIIVWVADEDDCSSPHGPESLVLQPNGLGGNPGADICVWDKNHGSQGEYSISEFSQYFTGLVAPSASKTTSSQPYLSLGAAFIVSAVRCADGSYQPADQCRTGPATASDGTNICPVQPPAVCAPPVPVCNLAFASGKRFFALADAFKGAGYSVVEGSVCDQFGKILKQIANLVNPPPMLPLSSTPASDEITVVRIVDANGNQRKVCTEQTAPVTDPQLASGWWFMDCEADASTGSPPVASAPTQCIFINHDAALNPDPALAARNGCEGNPGDTYSAEYLGRVPPGGCSSPTSDGTTASASCAASLGGHSTDWTCYARTTATVGTCLCRTGPG
jgi:hypothetical protein